MSGKTAVSVKALVADIRAGMSCRQLQEKHRCSANVLYGFLDKLVEKDMLSPAELRSLLSAQSQPAGPTRGKTAPSEPPPRPRRSAFSNKPAVYRKTGVIFAIAAVTAFTALFFLWADLEKMTDGGSSFRFMLKPEALKDPVGLIACCASAIFSVVSCGFTAKGKGRSVLWALAGLLCGVLGVGIVFTLSGERD
ncbi:MAG: hypothetical protein V2B18_09410 [Pseudomonadota bacterium]